MISVADFGFYSLRHVREALPIILRAMEDGGHTVISVSILEHGRQQHGEIFAVFVTYREANSPG